MSPVGQSNAGGLVWGLSVLCGAEQCQGVGLESECPLWGRAGCLICIWGWSMVWGEVPVSVGSWGLAQYGDTGVEGHPLLSYVCAAAALLLPSVSCVHSSAPCSPAPGAGRRITKGTFLTLLLIPRSRAFKPELPCIGTSAMSLAAAPNPQTTLEKS